MADHVLVVGNDGFQSGIRAFLRLNGAKVPTRKKVTNIQRYVKFLNDLPATELPVGTIFIGSHANEDGWLDIDLDDETKPERKNAHTDIKELVNAKTTGSVTLDAATVDATTSQVVFRGCRIGQSIPFMTLLREAFGGVVTVYAPKFFDDVTWRTKGKAIVSVVEWFAYGYEIVRATPFADRAEAVAAFTAKAATSPDFRDMDGGAIPAANWDAWLIGKRSKVWTVKTVTKKDKKTMTVPIGATIAKKKTFVANVGTRHYVHKWTYTITFSPGPAVKFATDADLRADMKLNLPPLDEFDPAKSPIPYHVQFGFASIDAFVDGVVWTQTKGTKKKKNVLTLTAKWHSYLAMPPVVNPANGNLCCNYAVSPTLAGETPFTQVAFTNPKFFGSA
jgi:hypothetical protein